MRRLADQITVESKAKVHNFENGQRPTRKSSTQLLALKQRSAAVKACKVCGECIEFNRRTAREWEKVEYCSAVCRRNRRMAARIPAAVEAHLYKTPVKFRPGAADKTHASAGNLQRTK
jgi:hypothetical protein